MTENKHSRIGIFDSGVGGLTVFKALQKQLPLESILYFGDNARVPYGTRAPAEILQFVREILTWMTPQVKMVVMACNTSSALALETVRCEFALPVLGLILPGARAAVRCGRRIGVIATPATACSKAYSRAIQEMNPEARVWEVGCPEFVPAIEENRLHEPYTRQMVKKHTLPLLQEARIDALVYGCTHYPHLEPILRAILPERIVRVDPAVSVAAAAAQEAGTFGIAQRSHPLTDSVSTASGCPERFADLSSQWLSYRPSVRQVQLPKLAPFSEVANTNLL